MPAAQILPAARSHRPAAAQEEIIDQAPVPAPQPQFQYDAGGSLFPNTDNKYVFETAHWEPERLLVITEERDDEKVRVRSSSASREHDVCVAKGRTRLKRAFMRNPR